jgi:hypothetical protein
VSLSDGDLAVLARQAVDLVSADIEIEIAPDAVDDPYRRGPASWVVWPRIGGHRSFGVYVESNSTPVQALARLIDALSDASETERFCGRPFPACPDHEHAAIVGVHGEVVVLTCPDTGTVVRRIPPELP